MNAQQRSERDATGRTNSVGPMPQRFGGCVIHAGDSVRPWLSIRASPRCSAAGHPLQQAGMGGIATPDLAIAVARAGGLGMLSAGPHLSELLDAVPFRAAVGVNFLDPGTEDVPALEEAAARSPFLECFWGEPNSRIIEIIHAGGARAGWQVGSAREARQAEDAGCDLIVAQGIEAGGHVREPRGCCRSSTRCRASLNCH